MPPKTKPKKSAKKPPVTLRMPPSWSHSRWSTYENCPRKAKLYYIDGYRSEGSDATNRGSDIHALAEAWLKSKKKLELPPIFAHFKVEFDMLRKLRAVAEVELGLTRDWEPCEYDDPNHWFHGKLDAVAMVTDQSALIVDFKTGKIRDYHAQQLELYALTVFIHNPEIEAIRCELWYIDQHKTTSNEYLRRQVPTLIKLWERRVAPMFNDTTFAPCPNWLCAYCDFAKKNGSGLCEY